MNTTTVIRVVSIVTFLFTLHATASAQWEVFEDPTVESQCGIINAASLEFAVRSCDGALVLVTGQDAGFINTFVTLDGTIEIDDEFAGFVVYEQDADGFFTLWWLSEEGFVIDFDDVAYEPFETDFLPIDFENVPCEAADMWEGDGGCQAEFGDLTMLPVEFFSDQIDQDGEDGSGCGIKCGPISLSIFLFGLIGLSLISRVRRF